MFTKTRTAILALLMSALPLATAAEENGTKSGKSISHLEEALKDLNIVAEPSFFLRYDPTVNYEREFVEEGKKLCQIPKVRYITTHALGLELIANDIVVKCDKTGKVISLQKDEPGYGRRSALDYQRNEGYRSLIGFGVRTRGVVSREDWNQEFFLFTTLLEQLAYKGLKQESDAWEAIPWRKPLPGQRDRAFINRQGEVVFYGADWCEPCKKVARYLLDNRIKFKEKGMNGTPPNARSDKGMLIGAKAILDRVNEIYGLGK